MNKSERPNCELCGEPMPEGEEMFKYHGYSGPCPKPPPMPPKPSLERTRCEFSRRNFRIAIEKGRFDE